MWCCSASAAESAPRAHGEPGGRVGVAVGPGARRRRAVGGQRRWRAARSRAARGRRSTAACQSPRCRRRRGRGRRAAWPAPPAGATARQRGRHDGGVGQDAAGRGVAAPGDRVAALPQRAHDGQLPRACGPCACPDVRRQGSTRGGGRRSQSRAASNSWRRPVELAGVVELRPRARRAARRAARRRARRSAATARAAAASTSRRRSAPWPASSRAPPRAARRARRAGSRAGGRRARCRTAPRARRPISRRHGQVLGRRVQDPLGAVEGLGQRRRGRARRSGRRDACRCPRGAAGRGRRAGRSGSRRRARRRWRPVRCRRRARPRASRSACGVSTTGGTPSRGASSGVDGARARAVGRRRDRRRRSAAVASRRPRIRTRPGLEAVVRRTTRPRAPERARSADEAGAHRVRDHLGAVAGADLAGDAGQVALHGERRQARARRRSPCWSGPRRPAGAPRPRGRRARRASRRAGGAG